MRIKQLVPLLLNTNTIYDFEIFDLQFQPNKPNKPINQ